MHIFWKSFDGFLLICSELSTLVELILKFCDLGSSWVLSSEKKPEDSLWDGLSTLNSPWSILLDVEEWCSTISNTLHWIEL